MNYDVDKSIKSLSELDEILRRRGSFLGYANSLSCRTASEITFDHYFLADGWPVAVWCSIYRMRKVPKLSFYNIRDFWVKVLSTKKFSVIGYSKLESEILANKIWEKNPSTFLSISDGFRDIDKIVDDIRSMDDGRLVFLGMGQPKQELVLAELGSLENSIVICCGAFFKQLYGLEADLNPIAAKIGLESVSRWWSQPMVLLNRTIFAVFFIPFRIKSRENV